MVYLRKASASVLFGISDIFLVGNAVEKEPAPRGAGMLQSVLQGLSETWAQHGKNRHYYVRHKEKRWNDQNLPKTIFHTNIQAMKDKKKSIEDLSFPWKYKSTLSTRD